MKLRRLLPLLPIFLLSCSPKKTEQNGVSIATKTVPEMLFFCAAEEGTQAELPGLAQKTIGGMFETLNRQGKHPAGNLQIICPEWKGLEGRSKFVFAIPVAQEFTVDAPYYIWKAPAFKCAWVEYRGAMPGIKDAWMKFAGDVEKSGLKTNASWREVYIYWVAPDSPEDRTELQMGIE
jgi:effector-binding domain-containing protein